MRKRRTNAWAVWMQLVVMAGFSVIGVMVSTAGAAEEYPRKPLTYTIFWPPGGRSDIVARMISPFIEKHLGTPVVVNNNVGGAGVIGHKEVREAKPDGYVLAQSGTTVMFQYTKPGINLSDYTWVANIYSAPFVIAVPSGSPFKSLKELVDFGKANPKKLRHGNSGTGSTTHLGSAGFAMKTGIEFTQIAYKGEGPAVIGIASAEVDVAFGPMVAFKQMIEAGKLRIPIFRRARSWDMISTGMPGRPFSDPKDSRRTGLSGRNCPRRSRKRSSTRSSGRNSSQSGLKSSTGQAKSWQNG
jgi:tripartite-type tricarboxylate transporter receptor subunit TctC